MKGIASGGRAERARALSVLARIIGKKRGVNIVFRAGVSASTDGKTIYLPALSDVATESDAILLEGLLDHEAMHCRFTDFEYMNHPDRQAAYKKHPLMFPIHNILEDVWGEREQARIYPGCFQNIKKSVDVMIGLGLYGGRVGLAKTAGDAMRGFILHALLGRLYDNPMLVAFGEDHKTNLIAHVGQKLTDEIWGLAVEVDRVTSTQQAFELAQKIFALIEAHLQTVPEKTKRWEVIVNMLQSSPEGGDIATMLEEALKLSGGVMKDQVTDPVPLAVHQADECDRLEGVDISALSRPAAITLGSKLEALLETKIEVDTSHGKSGRKVSSRKLSGIGVGRTAIFRREEEADGVDTAVEIVLDLSSSMYPSWESTIDCPHIIAKTATHAVADILDRHDIPFAVTAYGRHVVQVKGFGQKWRKRKTLLDLARMGGTRTAEALQHSVDSISQRTERRRMVVLVTDGDSNNNEAVIPVMNELTMLDVEFTSIFIGMGGESLELSMREAGYPVTRVENAAQLPSALFTAIKSAF